MPHLLTQVLPLWQQYSMFRVGQNCTYTCRTRPYIRSFPCQNIVYTPYIYMVLANPTYKSSEQSLLPRVGQNHTYQCCSGVYSKFRFALSLVENKCGLP